MALSLTIQTANAPKWPGVLTWAAQPHITCQNRSDSRVKTEVAHPERPAEKQLTPSR